MAHNGRVKRTLLLLVGGVALFAGCVNVNSAPAETIPALTAETVAPVTTVGPVVGVAALTVAWSALTADQKTTLCNGYHDGGTAFTRLAQSAFVDVTQASGGPGVSLVEFEAFLLAHCDVTTAP